MLLSLRRSMDTIHIAHSVTKCFTMRLITKQYEMSVYLHATAEDTNTDHPWNKKKELHALSPLNRKDRSESISSKFRYRERPTLLIRLATHQGICFVCSRV